MNRNSRNRGRKTGLRRALTALILVMYLVGALISGYWYYTRPVRADQFAAAQQKWRGIAVVFGLPVPKDERWGV